MPTNGSNILLLANTGTDAVPAYEAVGCQRDATFEETTETIDVSCKDSRAQRVLPGRYAGSISLDELYVPTDAAYLALRDANRNGELILVAREEFDVVTEYVPAKIDSISESFPDQGEAAVSIALTIDGFWVDAGS